MNFEDAFKKVFGTPDYIDRTKKVKAQGEILNAERLKTMQKGTMAVPLHPTIASKRASATYSEKPQGE